MFGQLGGNLVWLRGDKHTHREREREREMPKYYCSSGTERTRAVRPLISAP
jgi:hypothetical protein